MAFLRLKAMCIAFQCRL